MKKIKVNASVPYDVLIGGGMLDDAGRFIGEVARGRIMIVSDTNVFPLYGKRLVAALTGAGFEVETFVFRAGESNKTFATVESILCALADAHFDRNDSLAALGGGVTGDITGFAAAVYQRGIKFIQIPTTLLAAVDSSVGGKTGIDLPQGKNLAGAFHQPSAVLCDTDIISALPRRIFAEGMAEVIKYGVIADEKLFDELESGAVEIEEIICRSVECKRQLVERDEFDRGERMLLNYGHTFGHAAEKLSAFALSHGEAVAIGMVEAARYAAANGFAEDDITERLSALLKKYRLPCEMPFGKRAVASVMRIDKKRSAGRINLILPIKIGQAKIITQDENTFVENYCR